MRRDGVPIAHEVFPGNTADITAFKYVLERAKKRFSIKRVIIVADRAMVSKETLQMIDTMGYEYIFGMKMRNVKRIKDEVLSRRGKHQTVDETL